MVLLLLTGNWQWPSCWICTDNHCNCYIYLLHTLGHHNGM